MVLKSYNKTSRLQCLQVNVLRGIITTDLIMVMEAPATVMVLGAVRYCNSIKLLGREDAL